MDSVKTGDEGAKKTLGEAAALLKVSEEALQQTFYQVCEDPSTRYIVNISVDQN